MTHAMLPDLAWCLRFAMVLALALGLGSTLAFGLLVLRRAVFRPITSATVAAAGAMAEASGLGLVAVWCLGAVVLGAGLLRGADPLAEPGAVLALAIMIALTAAAGFVRGLVLPHLSARLGRRFHDDTGAHEHVAHAGVAALALGGWLALAALGPSVVTGAPIAAGPAAGALTAILSLGFLGALGLGLVVGRGRAPTPASAAPARADLYDVALDEAPARREARVA